MGRWAAGRERDKGCCRGGGGGGGGGDGGGGERDWGCVGRCELCGTVIKASLRRKCRTIYRRARRSIITTLMNGDTHALLIATSYYVPFMINSCTPGLRISPDFTGFRGIPWTSPDFTGLYWTSSDFEKFFGLY
ncbi:hypothetical protein G5I_10658 [Acromyrmex echinatior]|uniref:Uncharacterized protein n=1 Tax=Acromyrmex echinatior TaxID=103372 RepID=F4WXH3_ACREC|nr:hypothetical protein G5I_10658 [Acromyrmex echinatior]